MTFLYVVFSLSIFVLIVAAVVAGAFVIPLQMKEAGVKNGLNKLRKQLLLKGFLDFGMIIIAVSTLLMRYVIHDQEVLRYLTVTLVFFFSISFLGHVLIDFLTYRQNYTPENKKIHAQIEEIETQQGLKVRAGMDKRNKTARRKRRLDNSQRKG